MCMYLTENQNTWRQKCIELQEKADKFTLTVGDINTHLSVMNRFNRQNIGKKIIKLDSIIKQLERIDIYRILHSTIAEQTFFSNSLGTFTKRGHMLVHKAYLNKLKESYKICTQIIM